MTALTVVLLLRSPQYVGVSSKCVVELCVYVNHHPKLGGCEPTDRVAQFPSRNAQKLQ